MKNGLVSILQAKNEPAQLETGTSWDNVNEQYEKYSGYMDQLFEFNSGFFSIITLYIQTFAVFKVKTSLLPSISHSSIAIINQISSFNQEMAKFSEKVTVFGGEKDKLKRFLDSFSRGLCWFLGMTAYKLIKVKEDKD